jgi:RNase P subunit RPR2
MVHVDASAGSNGGAAVAYVTDRMAPQDERRKVELAEALKRSLCDYCGARLQAKAAAKHPGVCGSSACVRRASGEVKRALADRHQVVEVCADCGHSHATEKRLRIVLALLPSSFQDIRDLHRCFYGDWADKTGERRLYRDLRALRAVSKGCVWHARKVEVAR